MVVVQVDSELCSISKDFRSSLPNGEVCDRLYAITGVLPKDMKITLYCDGVQKFDGVAADWGQTPLAGLDGNAVTIKVEDVSEDSVVHQLKQANSSVSEAEVFKLSEEEYARKSGTVLQWKKESKLGRFNNDYRQHVEASRKLQLEAAQKLQLGQRCEVTSQDGSKRRGWLRFVGIVPEINDIDVWCGIEFDQPLGKNDGSVKDRVYFGPVGHNRGGFVKPTTVATSDQFQPLEPRSNSGELDSDEEL